MYKLKYIGNILSTQPKTKMTDFKKNQTVSATTIRGTVQIPGKVAAITSTLKGDWYTIKPDDKELKPFQTRASKITAQ